MGLEGDTVDSAQTEAATRRVLTLTDPRAVRMLAHAVRQDALEHLSGGQVLTATEAARAVGISPSAMSYHLRILERWGVVERVDSVDGRERPWRMAADRITIEDTHRGGMSSVAVDAILDGFLRRLTAALRALIERDDPREHATVSHVRGVWLTEEEASELDRIVSDAMRRFDDRRVAGECPAGATERDIYWLSIPHPTAQAEPEPDVGIDAS